MSTQHLSKNPLFSPLIVSLLIWFFYSFWQIAFGELIPINHGYGMDGNVYGFVAEDFFKNFLSVKSHRVSRLFSSFVVYWIWRILHIDPIPSNIILIFQILNAVLLGSVLITWDKILNLFNIQKKWVPFIFLFINFPILKMTFYYPTSVDTMAFVLAMWFFYCYFTRRLLLAWVFFILMSLTWITAIYFFPILLLFPYQSFRKQTQNDIHVKTDQSILFFNLKIDHIILFFISNICILACLFIARRAIQPATNWGIVLVGIFLFVLYVYLSTKDLLEAICRISFLKYLKKVQALNGFLLIIFFVSYQLVCGHFQKMALIQSPRMSTFHWFQAIIYLDLKQPLLFLVSHVVYFGPAVLLMIFWWKKLCEVFYQLGHGVVLLVLFSLFTVVLDAESRHGLHAIPVYYLALCIVFSKYSWSTIQQIILALVSLAFSRFWLNLERHLPEKDFLNHKINQIFYMNFGAWTLDHVFLIQSAFVLAGAIFIYYLFMRRFKSYG